MKRTLLLTAALLTIVLMACESKPAAVVNGDEITQESFEKALAQRTSSHDSRGAAYNETMLRKAVLDQLISEVLLMQGAAEENITVSNKELDDHVAFLKEHRGEQVFNNGLKAQNMTLKQYRDKTRRRILIDRFIVTLVPDNSVTKDEIRENYKTRHTPFIKPESVTIRFIQVNTREQADAVLKEIEQSKQGGFDSVADALRAEKKAIVSNYQPTIPDMFSKEISTALKALKKGEHGGPYKGSDAWYLFRLKDRVNEKPETFEESRGKIRGQLLDEKRSSTVAHWIARKREKARIAID